MTNHIHECRLCLIRNRWFQPTQDLIRLAKVMCVIYHNPQPEWSSHLGDINSKWLRRAKIRNGLRSIVRKLLMVFEPQFLIWATYVGFQDMGSANYYIMVWMHLKYKSKYFICSLTWHEIIELGYLLLWAAKKWMVCCPFQLLCWNF